MTDAPPPKPLPAQDQLGLEPFWQATLEGKLMLKRCSNCGAVMLPYRDVCDACLSAELEWIESSGKGTVATWAVMHQKYHPGWAVEVPYNITMVDLDEGPRIPTNLVGVENSDIQVGLPVVVDWERHDDLALPKFRPA